MSSAVHQPLLEQPGLTLRVLRTRSLSHPAPERGVALSDAEGVPKSNSPI